MGRSPGPPSPFLALRQARVGGVSLADQLPPPEKPLDAGRLFECYVAALCKAKGWRVVRTPHTDYGADVLVYTPDDDERPWFAIQCKYVSEPLGVAAVQAAHSGAAHYGARLAVLASNHRLTPQARNHADTIGVVPTTVGADTWQTGIILPMRLEFTP